MASGWRICGRAALPRGHDTPNMTQVKDRSHVPVQLRSCHTALVGGYVIEGHVPAADVQRLAHGEAEGAWTCGARYARGLAGDGGAGRTTLRRPHFRRGRKDDGLLDATAIVAGISRYFGI